MIVSPYHFGVIRKSVKKTDKHDARALSYYLSKGMLPEAHSKSVKKREINSLIGLRRKLVESRSKLILKVHSLFVRNGKKVYRDKFSTMFSFKKLTSSIKWSELESYELEVIEKQLELLYTQIAKLDGKIEEESKRLLGYNNLVSIKGIGSFTAGLILSNISDSATRSRGQELFSLSSLERKPHMLLCEPTQLNKVALGTKYKSNTRGRNRERTSLPISVMLG